MLGKLQSCKGNNDKRIHEKGYFSYFVVFIWDLIAKSYIESDST